MQQHQDDGDETILQDGERFRVPMQMMDSDTFDPIQQAVARSSDRIVAGDGSSGPNLHRPGFRLAATDARKRTTHYDPKVRLKGYSQTKIEEDDEEQGSERRTRHANMRGSRDAMSPLDAAYADHLHDLISAYKTPVGFGERGSVGQREGGTGMLDYGENAEDIVRSAATHTELARRRDHRTVEQTIRDHQDQMADIYANLDHELSEAWRRS